MLILSIILLVIGISLFFFYASYSIGSGVYIKALCRSERTDKVIALTFDDGPDKEQTPKVLDILKEYNVKACFFCIGNKIETNKELLKRIKDEGHLIGNHSYSHFFSFPLQSMRWIKGDLQACEQLIEEVTQEKVTLFRPPFGVTNPLIAKATKAMNYTTIGWSIRSLDTCRKTDEALLRIKRRLKPGSVILLHDPLPESDIFLRQTLDFILANGYEIKRVDDLFNLKKTEK